MFRIGLTGGIGSGKSSAARIFEALGAAVIDADKLAREAVEPGTAALDAICEHFGSSVLQPDGQLDRSALRQIVFAQPQQRAWLENLLHPAIGSLRRNHEQKIEAPYIIYEIPLLVETLDQQEIDRVLVVDVPADVQISRVQSRSNLSAEEVRTIIKQQTSREDRLAIAQDIIDNSGDEQSLVEQVKKLHAGYLQMAAQKEAATSD